MLWWDKEDRDYGLIDYAMRRINGDIDSDDFGYYPSYDDSLSDDEEGEEEGEEDEYGYEGKEKEDQEESESQKSEES